jgi:hypothetical protein
VKKLIATISRPGIPKAAVLVVPAAILAIVVTVAPSFAGSAFLTHHKATKLFLTKAEGLTNKEAKATYYNREQADKTFVAQDTLVPAPIAATVASNAAYGPVQSTTPVQIPQAGLGFHMPADGLLTITFSGVAGCTAATNGVGCPVQLLVDGQPASTGKGVFAVASAATPAPAASVQTMVETTIVGKGDHVVTAKYFGSTDTSAKFKLTNWNLVVQGTPTEIK